MTDQTDTPRTNAILDYGQRCESQHDDQIVTHSMCLARAMEEAEDLRDLSCQLERENAALSRQVEGLKAAAPLCEKHQPKGGTRSRCVICSLIRLSDALSRIDYVCGEPNDMEMSDYDVHYDEDAVVKRVEELKADAARWKEVERQGPKFNGAEHD